MTVLLGLVYPLFITGIARLAFPEKASGLLVRNEGKIIGSQWIGQSFTSPVYFTSRPSAVDYQAMPSGGSNQGPTSRTLYETMMKRKDAFIKNNRLPDGQPVPSEMLFASASGLDPHISPESARLQIERVAAERNLSEEQKQQLYDLVKKHTEMPQFGLLGASRVNVLMLNLELDKKVGKVR